MRMCERSESRFQSTQGTPESAKLHRVMTIGRTLNCRHVEITQRGLEGRSQVCPPSESAHSPGGSWPTQASFAHPASEYRTDGHDGYPPISRGRLFRIRSSDSRRAREEHPAAFSATATPPIGLPRPYSMPLSRLLPETPSSQNELEIKMSQADFPDHAAIVNVRLRVQRDCGRSRRNSSPSCLMSCVPMRAPAIGRNEDSF